MIDKTSILSNLKMLEQTADRKCACVGFDGFVDSLFRVVKSRVSAEEVTTFDTITEFAAHIAAAAGRSADMELQEISVRMGGNAPLMAQALGSLSVSTRCIGTMGWPEPEPVFSGDGLRFTPISLAPSAKCMALEYADGKLMFGQTQSLLTLNWEKIRQTVGLEELRRIYRESSLWGIVNWSFLLCSNDIVEGFLADVVEYWGDGKQKYLFFDLADPSGRSREDVRKLCSLMGRLNDAVKVTLGLNENESVKLAAVLELPEGGSSEERAEALRQTLGVDYVVIHGLSYAVGASGDGIFRAESIFNPNPVLSTGGGDNFNAGLCTALIHGLDLECALLFGNMVSSYYVTYGHSPSLSQLAGYIEESL